MRLPGYDAWKLATPPEYECDDGAGEDDCTCKSWRSRSRDCPVHGIDPDRAYDEWRDRQMG